jgi:ankyrin repeat protein
MDHTDQIAAELTLAIKGGDIPALERLLAARPGLATARITGPKGPDGGIRTPLHIVADWPGYFPAGPAIASILLRSGADPDVRTAEGRGGETPLHWTASSDDADVAEALIDGGADIEAADGSIGTPLENAVGYGCWHVARLLVARGARVDKLWTAAALGILPRVEELLAPDRTADDLNEAFWQACHGGQRRAAELLLSRGADPSAVPGYSEQTAAQVAAALDTQRENLVSWLGERTGS